MPTVPIMLVVLCRCTIEALRRAPYIVRGAGHDNLVELDPEAYFTAISCFLEAIQTQATLADAPPAPAGTAIAGTTTTMPGGPPPAIPPPDPRVLAESYAVAVAEAEQERRREQQRRAAQLEVDLAGARVALGGAIS